jgi:hypothetical protein
MGQQFYGRPIKWLWEEWPNFVRVKFNRRSSIANAYADAENANHTKPGNLLYWKNHKFIIIYNLIYVIYKPYFAAYPD